MKPEAQRIAIAEVCGWKWIRTDDEKGEPRFHMIVRPDAVEQCCIAGAYVCDRPTAYLHEYRNTPDYLSDLNAMHQAEEHAGFTKTKSTQTNPKANRYWHDLLEACRRDGAGQWLHCATAAQRAEAFLRTIGKWEDAA